MNAARLSETPPVVDIDTARQSVYVKDDNNDNN